MANLCFVSNIHVYVVVNFVSRNDVNVTLCCLSVLNINNYTSSNFLGFFILPKGVLPLSGFFLRMPLSETLGNGVAELVFHA